ncbi:MFS transporter [Marinagarivorans algicola]|uniref:MFS transporter n=1 Tax=Marinagarivorans algicola TaxID=1513270 RepID=UPI0006B67A8B|nr:MFS transporter [Marinagarivorans algicola]
MAIAPSHKLSFTEKTGYAMGDAAANLVWRGALAYIAIFYTDTLGISAAAAATLLLLVRLSDGITDIIMGMIADRTTSRHGRFRPWIIWSAPVLALFMVLAFTAPDISPGMKLVWAYFTYIGLTLAYTINNVPYSALMGVMTPSHTERTILSGYRFAGAFAGGVLVMSFTPDMVNYFGQGDDVKGYQQTFYVFAGLLVVLCSITFFTTKERVEPPKLEGVQAGFGEMFKSVALMCIPLGAISLFFVRQDLISGIIFAIVISATGIFLSKFIKKPESETTSSQRDLIDLLTNKPWLMLLGLGLFTMFYNGIRFGTVAYYFTHYMGDASLGGKFFFVTTLVSMFAAVIAGYLTTWLGKKVLFAISLIGSSILTSGIYFAQPEDVTLVFTLGVSAEFFAAFMPVLVFSMLGDAADYSEWKNGRRATGLLYSAGTFIQKMGGGFAGALVLLVLASYGYVGTDPDTISQAKAGMVNLMSWIPSIFSISAIGLLIFYPLNTQRMSQIEADLIARRAQKENA